MREGLEFAAGAALVLIALFDVFATMLVPGPVTSRFNLIIHTRRALLPLWRRSGGARPSNGYAPFAFLVTFLCWGVLLLFGFGLMFDAIGDRFQPVLAGPSDGIWVAGLSLLTLGVSEFGADGLARGLILFAGLVGFGALTTAITFIFQVQAGLSDREPAVLALAAVAGTPPSGIGLLEELAALDARRELGGFFDEWRDWAAATQHSHLAYPVLNYFRSMDGEGDWLAALEAVLDAAAMLVACTDEPEGRAAATLLLRTGSRAAERLVRALRLSPTPGGAAGDIAPPLDRLERAGYPVREEGAAARFSDLRSGYAPYLDALGEHLGVAGPSEVRA